MEEGVTVFTPTYNRAYRLPALYQSLCGQTCQKFEWLIVDDGSTDDTKSLVKHWLDEHKIGIRYYSQENSGKAQAHNRGVELARMRLFTCVDSDDILVSNAIERILAMWDEYPDKIGIICARMGMDHRPTTYWKGKVQYCTLYNAYRKYGLRGEAMLIYQSNIIKKYQFPKFEGEKFIRESYLYDLLDQEGVMYITREALYISEYLPDGYTRNSHRLVQENRRGYQAYLIQRLKLDKKLRYKAVDTLEYILNKQAMKDGRLIDDSVYPILTGMLYIVVCLYDKIKNVAVLQPVFDGLRKRMSIGYIPLRDRHIQKKMKAEGADCS